MKKNLLNYTAPLAFSLVLSANSQAEVSDESFAHIANTEAFSSLADYITERGFSVEMHQFGQSYTGAELASQAGLKSIDDDFELSLVPFISKDGQSARVAYWAGYWNGEYKEGALATVDTNEMFWYQDGDIMPVGLSELADKIGFPIFLASGEVPFGQSQLEVTTQENNIATSQLELAAASGCKQVDASRRGYTLLGFVAWRFHHVKEFCYNGDDVYNVTMWEYVSEMDPLFNYRGVVSSSDHFGPGNNSHTSLRQAHIENCVIKYGCIGSLYPSVEIVAHSNGSHDTRTWQ